MTDPEIESLERAVLAAVAPPLVEELPGWLLAFDDGTVGRARSAVPIRHGAVQPDIIEQIEARYVAHGLPALYRIPDSAAFDAVRAELESRGYVLTKPTQMQTARASDVVGSSRAPAAEVTTEPDDAWASVFLGEGFDPVDGASRVRTLRRANGSLFASVREGGEVIAGGVLSLSNGWASIHGLRTALPHRGRGLAARIIATFANVAMARGYERMMLQVERDNPATRLYARCGFTRVWSYAYWEKPAQK